LARMIKPEVISIGEVGDIGGASVSSSPLNMIVWRCNTGLANQGAIILRSTDEIVPAGRRVNRNIIILYRLIIVDHAPAYGRCGNIGGGLKSAVVGANSGIWISRTEGQEVNIGVTVGI